LLPRDVQGAQEDDAKRKKAQKSGEVLPPSTSRAGHASVSLLHRCCTSPCRVPVRSRLVLTPARLPNNASPKHRLRLVLSAHSRAILFSQNIDDIEFDASNDEINKFCAKVSLPLP